MLNPWTKEKLITETGTEVDAYAPVIISASRSTDIPAFYTKWLIERINKGYIVWKNPFNQHLQYISLLKARLFVFWSKNPKPLIENLSFFDKRNINYYFQFTLNDYEKEGYEPNVPNLSKRIDTFKRLSEKIGKEKLIWRFDPLLLTDKISVDLLLEKIYNVGNQIHNYTDKLVFSFADISVYKKVLNNLKRESIDCVEFNKDLMLGFSKSLSELNIKWGLELSTCCEEIELEKFNITHNKCIDDNLIIRLFRNDDVLMDFLGVTKNEQPDLFGKESSKGHQHLKDKGQRKICGCIVSKDIGEYNTCNHLCVYCYANTSQKVVKENIRFHSFKNEGIIYKNT